MIILKMNQYLPEKYQKEEVTIAGEWSENDDSLNISSINYWEVHSLQLQKNKRKMILKEISHIHFSSLRILRVWKNQIQSVEGLSRIHLPQIKDLNICFNRLHSMAATRKAHWPKLQKFFVDHNYLTDHCTISVNYFPILKKLRTKFFMFGMDSNFYDPCSPAKLQTQHMEQLIVRSDKLTLSKELLRILTQKWKQIRIPQ